MKKIIYFILLLLYITSYGQLKEGLSKEKEFELLSKEISEFWINSPLILDDKIIFFYRGTGKEKKVVIGGDFTEWKPLLLMEKKSTNMWQYVWDERLEKGNYKYRLLVDDVWINDPQNTNFIVDSYGEKISFFELEEDLIPDTKNPVWIKKDIYEFRYYDTKAKNVYLVGNFNNWNPYKTPLQFKGAGEFSVRLRFKPGLYVYCFVVDDKWMPDSRNLNQYSDNLGNTVSIFYVKKK